MLSKFKDILGKPGEGIHFHAFGFAIMDLIGTVVLGLLIWLTIRRSYKINPLWIIFGLLVFGELLHCLFGVDTTFIKLWK